MNNLIAYLIVSFLGGAGIIILLLLWIVHNIDKYERLLSYLFRGLSFLNKKWKYSRAATDLQASINLASREINEQGTNILPHAMKVEFLQKAHEVETFMRKGEIIVTLGRSKDRERDLMVSALAYVKKDLIPNTRAYIDDTMMKATDYTVTKDILISTKRDAAVSLFLQSCLEPEFKAIPTLKDDCLRLEKINKIGFFYHIFLTQLIFYGEKLFPTVPTAAAKNEIRVFAKFLQDIAMRERGEEVNLDFIKTRMRVKVMLIAREETKRNGTLLYSRRISRRIKQAHSDGIEYIYICAWGKENCELAKEVASEQAKTGILSITSANVFKHFFNKDRSVTAICVVCAVNLRKSPEDALGALGVFAQLLEKHIEEVRDGKVDIVSIAREPGILCKVCVKTSVDNFDAVGCIINGLRNRDLVSALGSEKVQVIEWQDDPKMMVILSITTIEEEDISHIKLDKSSRHAYVTIEGSKMSKAIGRDGINIKLANQLTGWNVTIIKNKE